MIQLPDNPVLFFDGVCNLCNQSVLFVIRHDKAGKIKFATLQSETGASARETLLQQQGHVPDSLILLEHNKYYTLSSAALHLAGHLDGGWKLLKILLVIPPFIRNAVYKLIARNRYKWFGKRDECMLPTPALKARFLP